MAALAATGCGVTRTGGIEYDLGRSDVLRVQNWPDYLDPALLEDIAALMGIPQANLTYSEGYEDNSYGWDRLIEPMRGGIFPGFDIIVPTNWLAARMIDEGLAEPIPLELIPNHVNLDPAYMTQDWDRGARMQMPWQAGITGIAWNPEFVGEELRSLNQLLRPSFDGQVGMVGEMREALGFVMLAMGEDPSRPTEGTAVAAMDLLVALNATGRFKWGFGELLADDMGARTMAATMAWSGDTVQFQQSQAGLADGVDVTFTIPDEGAIQWFDTMVIPKGSPNIAAAGAFMNAVYEVDLAASLTEWVQYISPVLGVREELLSRPGDAPLLAENPILFPDDATRRRLYTWGSLPIDVEMELERRFDEIAFA